MRKLIEEGITWFLIGAAVTFTAACVWATGARAADSACGQRDEIVAQLGEKYKETPAAVALSSNGVLLEVLESTDGATWTIIASRPDGVSCLVAAGEQWRNLPKAPAGDSL